ncbi:MAG: TetR/AcrR family transcriptional regulator [Anaeromicrobium sp.]|jgi:AcrR family transcriptional regulator|uniref:TetR/AcrR family transcriptional regulator n=1 Tax=Anaeromicrobium sp. TaxID=1929132 RepID=UPI0025CC4049|nr:TetR/AcrR family transcriptional regulator [Anaeromicrobium sp.]MCT4593678.1 TetR/AcrR family transcriptional regulator [Anaeromicrobium sp.]
MLKRKDKILISAIELLDAEGTNGVTTKKLAKLQKVTEPALYRQFKSKQDILNHIIEEYASYDEKIINTIKESGLRGKEAIEFYVKRFAELYQNYSELTTIMFSMDLYQYKERTKERMQEIVKRRIFFLESIIKEDSTEFSCMNQYDEREMASLINGTIFSQVYEWRIMDKSYPLDERLIKFIGKLV